jgi:predicted RNase H-like HicB family nuclease
MRPFIRPFIAFIRKQSGPGFGVWFPDLPDCQTTGQTIAEARQNAERELALHCRHLQDAGAPVPAPSYMHELFWGRDLLEGLVVLISPPQAA